MSEDQEHFHIQSLNTIPDGHVTDKLANRLYDRISANGWPKLGGYCSNRVAKDARNTEHGDAGGMVNCEGFLAWAIA
jgi:hypothetical protein